MLFCVCCILRKTRFANTLALSGWGTPVRTTRADWKIKAATVFLFDVRIRMMMAWAWVVLSVGSMLCNSQKLFKSQWLSIYFKNNSTI
jgi:hypothetical protein